jgi:hypothetical protein
LSGEQTGRKLTKSRSKVITSSIANMAWKGTSTSAEPWMSVHRHRQRCTKEEGGLFRRARYPHRASDIARKAIYNSQGSCAVVTKIALARCPSTPPSLNVKLSQLNVDGHHDKIPLTSTMLITETHKDVPTQAGGDMSAFARIMFACN